MLSWTAAKAAENASKEDVEHLRVALQNLLIAATIQDIQLADYAFFEAMVTAANNRVIMLIANGIREVYLQNSALFLGLYAVNFETTDHQRAFEAIETKDAKGAHSAMESYGRRALGGGAA